MEMTDIVNLAVNNGVAILVIAYFMYRDYKFMGTLQTTLTTLVATVDSLKDCVNELKLIGFHMETDEKEE